MSYTLGRVGLVAYGAYDSMKNYVPLDIVTSSGNSTYVAKAPTKGNPPTNTEFWVKLRDQDFIVATYVAQGLGNPVSSAAVYSFTNSAIAAAIG